MTRIDDDNLITTAAVLNIHVSSKVAFDTVIVEDVMHSDVPN